MILEHAELENLLFYVNQQEQLCMSRPKTSPLEQPGELVFGQNMGANMRFCHLLAAAPLMYQTLSQQAHALQGLIDAIDSLPHGDHTDALQKQLIVMQNGCFLAQRVAQIGVDEAAKLFTKKP